MKATNALVAAAVAGVLAAGTQVLSAAPAEHAISAEKKKDDCPGKKKDKDKDKCPSKDKKKDKGTIL